MSTPVVTLHFNTATGTLSMPDVRTIEIDGVHYSPDWLRGMAKADGELYVVERTDDGQALMMRTVRVVVGSDDAKLRVERT